MANFLVTRLREFESAKFGLTKFHLAWTTAIGMPQASWSHRLAAALQAIILLYSWAASREARPLLASKAFVATRALAVVAAFALVLAVTFNQRILDPKMLPAGEGPFAVSSDQETIELGLPAEKIEAATLTPELPVLSKPLAAARLPQSFPSLVNVLEKHALEPSKSEKASRDISKPHDVKEIQRRLAKLGFLSASPVGIWGPRSRQALFAFKEATGLSPDDQWDDATEAQLFSDQAPFGFVGVWAADVAGCALSGNTDGLLPALITEQGARAGEVSCAFIRNAQSGKEWTVAAQCGNGRSNWTSTVRLAVSGNRLIWSSERGVLRYVRCDRGSTSVAGIRS